MKIVFVSHYPELLGANLSLLNLIDGLQKLHGVKCRVVVVADGPLLTELKRRNIEVDIVPFNSWVHEGNATHTWRDTLYKLRRNFALAKAYKNQLGIDVNYVYTNASVTGFGITLAWLLGKPHIWHIREFLEEHYGRKYDLPYWLLNIAIRMAHKVVLVSESLKKVGFLNGANVVVVPNGVFWKDEIKTVAIPQYTKPLAVCCVGLLHPAKNQLQIIEAVKIAVQKYGIDIRLNLIGQSALGYEEVLQQYVKENTLSNYVNFTGYMPAAEWLGQCNVLISASKNESFGRVLVEAMAQGIPVIGNASTGTVDIIKDYECGLLYHDTAEQLAAKMNELYTNPQLYKKLCTNGIVEAREKYTVEKYAHAIYSLLKHKT